MALTGVVAIAVIAVTSWVLDVAAKAPSLAACRPVDRGGNTTLYAADGSKLGVIASDRGPALRSRSRSSRATCSWRPWRSRTSASTSTAALDPQGILRAAVKDLEAGEGGRGRLDDHPAAGPQPLHPATRRTPSNARSSKRSWRSSTPSSTQSGEILGQYLNTASYGTIGGATAVGVQAASRIYFSRPVWKLDLEQAALLAGLPQAPSQYNPILNPRAARARRNEVLGKMAELGYLSPALATRAERSGLELDPSHGYFAHRQPYFFDYVENRLIAKYGAQTVRNGGLAGLHDDRARSCRASACEAMRSTLPDPSDPSSALVSIDPRNGDIRAMDSNSPDYADNQFNLAAQGHRQPGSTFKAFVLTTAIKQGIDPYTTYYVSKPLNLNLPKWGHWTVHTADEGYQGTINLKQATVTSDNTVFAQLDLDVGPANVAATAKSMGITTHLQGLPAEGIGGLRIGVSPLELADAYATLASGGIRHNPVAIRRVVFPDGQGRTSRSGRAEAGDQQGGRLPGDAAAARQHHRRDRHRRLHRLRGAGRQDGDNRQLHRRLVLRLPAQPGQRGLGRIPAVQRDLDDRRQRDHRLRRHLPGGNLALALRQCRRALRGHHAALRKGELGAVLRPVHGLRAGRRRCARDRCARAAAAAPPGSGAVGGYNPDAYAPGLGQKPAPAPPPLPPEPNPSSRGGVAEGLPHGGEEWLAEHRLQGRAYALMWVGFAAYLGVLVAAPRLGRRVVWGLIAVAVLGFALAPPLLSHDVYSYVDYARLGVLHGIDPYVRGPAAAPADPAFPTSPGPTRPAPTGRCSRWPPIRSPGCRSPLRCGR